MRAPKKTLDHAKRLRASLSPPELRLWIRLRTLRPQGVHFRSQHAVGPYVLDFYCSAARLAVEVDGFAHNTEDRPQRDERRDGWLHERGIEVLRLPAGEVLKDPDVAAEMVYRTAQARIQAEPA